jgi:hypothetical protein|tara:strand:- start:2032 stop:2436 length:405 start_codon:yes stop_codon:yes gene_type:complete
MGEHEMSRSRAATAETQQANERDRFWLDHEAAQGASGQTAKEYAAAQGLSLHAFYQARKRLRALGLLAAAPGRSKRARKRPQGKAISFSKVAVMPTVTDPRFRLELPGGMALEWSGGDVPESVAVLLERLARPA